MVIMFKYSQGNVTKMSDLYWVVKDMKRTLVILDTDFCLKLLQYIFEFLFWNIWSKEDLISFEFLCNINYKHITGK